MSSASKKPGDEKKTKSLRFILLFFFFVVGLTSLVRLPWIDLNLVLPYTKAIAWFSASTFQMFGVEVEPIQTVLRHSHFSVDIRRGCDGLVATMILISACLAYPSPWKQKLVGVAIGYILIFSFNLLRILILFGLGLLGWMHLFEFVHVYIAQFFVIAVAVLYWISWAGRLRTSS